MEFNSLKIYSLVSVRSLYSIYNLTFDKNYSFPGETHNFWELSCTMHGTVGITIGDSVYECAEGEITVTAPNVFHSMWIKNDQPAECFTITFDGSGFENRMPEGKFTVTEKEKFNIKCILDEIPGIFKGWNIDEHSKLKGIPPPDDCGYQIIKSHLELLCLSLMRRGNDERGNPSVSERSRRYSEVVRYLKDNLNRSLTIEQICAELYESPGTIKSIFRQYTGGGVMKFYNQMRCEYCMGLISEGVPIKKIAEIMNFSSQFYFSYFFKRETGVSPSEYKHIIRSKNEGNSDSK